MTVSLGDEYVEHLRAGYRDAVERMHEAGAEVQRELARRQLRRPARDAIAAALAVADDDYQGLAAILAPYTTREAFACLVAALAALPAAFEHDDQTLRSQLAELAIAAAATSRDGRGQQ